MSLIIIGSAIAASTAFSSLIYVHMRKRVKRSVAQAKAEVVKQAKTKVKDGARHMAGHVTGKHKRTYQTKTRHAKQYQSRRQHRRRV
jgi:hypothetical protein